MGTRVAAHLKTYNLCPAIDDIESIIQISCVYSRGDSKLAYFKSIETTTTLSETTFSGITV